MLSIQDLFTWQSKLLMAYKHLNQAERYHIHALIKAGHDQPMNMRTFAFLFLKIYIPPGGQKKQCDGGGFGRADYSVDGSGGMTAKKG